MIGSQGRARDTTTGLAAEPLVLITASSYRGVRPTRVGLQTLITLLLLAVVINAATRSLTRPIIRQQMMPIFSPVQPTHLSTVRCGSGETPHLFLPRDAMLARYVLSSCVRPSVRLSVTSRTGKNHWTKRAGFWHEGFLPSIPHCDIWASPKISVGWNCVPNSGLRKFRRGKSIALSTTLVVVVDDDGRAYSKEFFGVHNFKSSCMM